MKKFELFFILLLTVFCGNLYAQGTTHTITATIPYNNEYASGTFRIYRNYFNYNVTLNNLRKPIIFVEGFDPNQDFEIGDLADMIYSGGVAGLGQRLNAQGFDIIILNFDQGGDKIQKNAFLLAELIKQINLQKPTNDPLTVIGFSMGGLVARYALTYMEEHEAITGAHQTGLFVSFDSPHKGAHIPVGIQALAMTFNSPTYTQLFPDLGSSLRQFTAPAALQMLKYRLTSATVPTGEIPVSTDYTNFMDELNGLNNCNGFPTKCRNIALTLGSWNGVGQRSNIDLDNDGVLDLQHSGFPTLMINIPQSTGGSNNSYIWQLNTCQTVAAFGFQIMMSTAYSDNYPHFNQRSSYGNLGNGAHPSYLYLNNSPLPIFPSGGWSRLWHYPNYDPVDFAPGAFVPAYEDILDALNSQIDCSFGYISNSTFVPTISALCFDTDDYFHNISNDPNRLDKTPFDAIYGIDGDNTSHRSNQTSNAAIVSALVDEINNSYGFTCSKQYELITGTAPQSQFVKSGIRTIEASNFNVNNASNVNLVAGKEVVLLPGVTIDGGLFVAEVQPCVSKACYWESATPLKRPGQRVVDVDTIDLLSDLIVQTKFQEGDKPGASGVDVYPTVSNGAFVINTNIVSGNFKIMNTIGITVFTDVIKYGSHKYLLNLPSGNYDIVFYETDSRKQFKKKLVIVK